MTAPRARARTPSRGIRVDARRASVFRLGEATACHGRTTTRLRWARSGRIGLKKPQRAPMASSTIRRIAASASPRSAPGSTTTTRAARARSSIDRL